LPADANRGAAVARNRGIQRAAGSYVAFLDADDVWYPSKISSQVRMIEQNANVTLVTCDCLFLDGSGNPRGTFYQRRSPVAGGNAWRVLLAYNFIQTSTVLARKSVLDELGGFSEVLPTGEDQDLWIRLAAQGEVEVAPKTLVHVFDQPESLAKRYQRREGDLLLSIIGAQMREHGHLLTVDQIRSAWGQRLFDIAANSFHNTLYGYSAPLFWRAACLGFRPAKSLINVARAAILGMLNRDDTFNLRAWREGLTRASVPMCERSNVEGGQA
jgi:glycosyltransferase involved in cell wall biosynthesis